MEENVEYWTAIVVTTRTAREAQDIEHELLIYQKKNIISSKTFIFTIDDPSPEKSAGVGSGGATLNALLYSVEQLSARRGYQVLSPDVLLGSRILIIHQGRSYPFGCSRAFTLLPCITNTWSHEELTSNLLDLTALLTEKLLPAFEDGVWVCSSDMMILYQDHSELTKQFSEPPDACVISVPATPEYATNHGVIVSNEKGDAKDILYTAPLEVLTKVAKEDGTVSLVSGIVFLSVKVAEKLLVLQASPTLECCTYLGSDVGHRPQPVSLYFDIILAMCTGADEADFLRRGSTIRRMDSKEQGDAGNEYASRVRRLIWENMKDFKLTTASLTNASHHYFSIGMCSQEHLNTLAALIHTTNSSQLHSWKQFCGELDSQYEEMQLINTYFHQKHPPNGKIFAVNCHIDDRLQFQSNAFLYNIDTRQSYFSTPELTLKSDLCLQVIDMVLQLHNKDRVQVPVVFGMNDILMEDFGSYCSMKWPEFFRLTGINSSDLWPSEVNRKNVWNAKLFPVLTASGEAKIEGLFWAFQSMEITAEKLAKWKSSWRFSLEEIHQNVDFASQFNQRRLLYHEIFVLKLTETLRNGEDLAVLPYFRSAVVDGHAATVLNALDSVSASSRSLGVVARSLALTADMIGCMAQEQGGLRSGPAANQAFLHAFALLEKGQVTAGVALLAKERKNWMNRPDLMIRCARHYEGAAQICIRQAVSSAKQFISLTDCGKPSWSESEWTICECAARIDLSGGWTDTPPITYEKGGLVVNAALLIDGKRPIGAKVRRTQRLSIILGSDVNNAIEGSEITNLHDLKDFCIPSAPGALLKASILFAEIVTLNSEELLEEQLKSKWSSGFEVVTWSNLPQGSGLGTSSILAAAIISALWSASGKKFDNEAVVHAVLCIEQMLTTGGGWQDQVGGVFGGFKAASSTASLPLYVTVEKLSINHNFIDDFNSRILLIFTGKPRLAKNLLQSVIRNWYARETEVVHTCAGLVRNAKKCKEAIENWDLATFCECITRYYEQKKLMASGTEPASVKKMLQLLQPFIIAHTLAGAGGGGFLFCLLRNPADRDQVIEVLHKSKENFGATVFPASLDVEGISIRTETI